MSLHGYKDLKVFQKAYATAMEIYHISKEFPKHFISKLSNSGAGCAEAMIHLSFAKDCGYLNEENYNKLIENYIQTRRMRGNRMQSPERFAPQSLHSAF